MWQALQLESAETVLKLDSARVHWPVFKGIGLIGAHPVGSECDYEVRMLAPSSGMREDPITGSLNAALAHWLQVEGRLNSAVTVAQGTCIGRLGRVSIIPVDQHEAKIGGQSHILVDGTVFCRDRHVRRGFLFCDRKVASANQSVNISAV